MKKLILLISIIIIAVVYHPVKSEHNIGKLDTEIERMKNEYEILARAAWTNGIVEVVLLSKTTNINNMKMEQIIAICKKDSWSFMNK